MRILGIDPGFGRVGYGIIDFGKNGPVHVAHGCIETPAHTAFLKRLSLVHTEIAKLIEIYQPVCAGVEDLFFAKNAKTAMDVGQARGVILLTLHQANLPIIQPKPNEIKQAVVGYGNADKKQIQAMVKMMLKLDEVPKPDDAADGLAVAITVGLLARFLKKQQKV